MTNAGTNRTRGKGSSHRVLLVLGAILLFLTAPRASANTYLFSFTGQQALNALEDSLHTAEHMQSAYFALFLQPDPIQISGYSYASYNAPSPNAAEPWNVGTISDPSAPELGYDWEFPCEQDCAWVKWGKGYFDD